MLPGTKLHYNMKCNLVPYKEEHIDIVKYIESHICNFKSYQQIPSYLYGYYIILDNNQHYKIIIHSNNVNVISKEYKNKIFIIVKERINLYRLDVEVYERGYELDVSKRIYNNFFYLDGENSVLGIKDIKSTFFCDDKGDNPGCERITISIGEEQTLGLIDENVNIINNYELFVVSDNEKYPVEYESNNQFIYIYNWSEEVKKSESSEIDHQLIFELYLCEELVDSKKFKIKYKRSSYIVLDVVEGITFVSVVLAEIVDFAHVAYLVKNRLINPNTIQVIIYAMKVLSYDFYILLATYGCFEFIRHVVIDGKIEHEGEEQELNIQLK